MTLGRARHQSSIARERLMWKRAFEFPRQYARAFPRDFTFVRRAVHRIRPHFGHGRGLDLGCETLGKRECREFSGSHLFKTDEFYRLSPSGSFSPLRTASISQTRCCMSVFDSIARIPRSRAFSER